MRKELVRKSKFVFLLIVGLFFMSLKVMAQTLDDEVQVKLSVAWEHDLPTNPTTPKTPITIPTLWQNGSLLNFQEPHADYVLNLYDDNENLVYTTFVPSSTTMVVLPSSLIGDFELHLEFGGSYYFYGYISL